MSATRLILCGMIALLISACGHVVSDSLSVPPSVTPQSCGLNKTIILLPFADYTYADDLETTFNRNLALMEALTDQLITKGFSIPVQEDTLEYLIDQNIIKGMPYQAVSSTKTVEREVSEGAWSGPMKDELQKIIDETNQKASTGSKSPGMHGLDKQLIIKLGKQFNADYILRGRIIKYDMINENKWQPWRRGLLPVIIDGTDRTILGLAKPELYDLFEGVLGMESARSIVGNAQVYVRAWVQDTVTGEVIWTNRVEVEVAPKSVFAQNNVDKMFHAAVNRAAKSLVEDFWKKNELYL